MKSIIVNVKIGVFCVTLVLCNTITYAYTLSDGVDIFCKVVWDGKLINVEEQYVSNESEDGWQPELGGAAAVIKYAENGYPIIVFDKNVMAGIHKKLPLQTDFIFYHECAHVRYKSDDEFYTNCWAVVDMFADGRLDSNKFFWLEKYHLNMRLLPVKYGGAGFVFWEKTERCLRKLDHPLVREGDS